MVLDDFVLANKVLGFYPDPITLKSGRSSYFYVNWREATTDAFLLDELTDLVVAYLGKLGFGFDSLVGVPEGASKIALLTAFKWAKQDPAFGVGSHVISMGRAAPKSHGKPEDRFFVGRPRGRILVMEDTTTTGQSMIGFIKDLQAAGFAIAGALSLTDRMQRRADGLSPQEAIAQDCGADIPYISLSRATDLIPKLAQTSEISSILREHLSREFANYGVKPLVW